MRKLLVPRSNQYFLVEYLWVEHQIFEHQTDAIIFLMPREVHLRLRELLARLKPGTPRSEVAQALNITENTVRGYLENRWTSLDRSVLERFADYLDCDASEFLDTRESSFFRPFHDPGGRQCYYLRRPDADQLRENKPLAFIDDQALYTMTKLLRNVGEGTEVFPSSTVTQAEFHEKAAHNCVVVAAPRVNPATEMALCEAFHLELPSANTIQKAPFRFMWHPIQHAPLSTFGETSTAGKCGILFTDEDLLIPADYCPLEEFRSKPMRNARDCAVVLVMNRRTSAGNRKLIVLAGFSGGGTQAAAMAVASDYRDLEPLENEQLVWGVIEVLYRKHANTLERTITNRGWRVRYGGRNPIACKPKELSARGGNRTSAGFSS